MVLGPQERYFRPCYEDGTHWIWTGASDKTGRGQFMLDNKQIAATRASYIIFVGEIPLGKWVLHTLECEMELCHIKNHKGFSLHHSCVAPNCLYLGTHKDNVKDRDSHMQDHHPQAACCWRGHPFDKINTHIAKTTGAQFCLACHYLRHPDRKVPEKLIPYLQSTSKEKIIRWKPTIPTLLI